MKRIRRHLSYANVLSTLTAFVVLTGATAFAAQQLGKKTVGTKQLKPNAVTKGKIKRNAVTTAKIRKNAVNRARIKAGAVDGSRVKDGSLTGSDINAASMPFAQIVHEARGTTTEAITEAKPSLYPLGNPNYTQEAGRDDSFMGSLDITFEPSCIAPRHITVLALLDTSDPSEVKSLTDVVAAGMATDETGTQPTQRVDMGPYIGGSFQPTSPTAHRIDIVSLIECEGGGDGAKATSGAVDVIGVR